jgi:hypothetical protein
LLNRICKADICVVDSVSTGVGASGTFGVTLCKRDVRTLIPRGAVPLRCYYMRSKTIEMFAEFTSDAESRLGSLIGVKGLRFSVAQPFRYYNIGAGSLPSRFARVARERRYASCRQSCCGVSPLKAAIKRPHCATSTICFAEPEYRCIEAKVSNYRASPVRDLSRLEYVTWLLCGSPSAVVGV